MSFNLDVSVWSQRLNKFDDIVLEVMEIVNAIDFVELNRKDEFKDYLSNLEQILSDWKPKRSLNDLCKYLSDAAKTSPENNRWLEQCHQQVLFSKHPESRKELRQIINSIQRLRLDPVVFAVRKSINAVNLNFNRKMISLKLPSQGISPHRIYSFRQIENFYQALVWGFSDLIYRKIPIDQKSTIKIELSRSAHCIQRKIICTVYLPIVSGIHQVLLPLRTRLFHLGIISTVEIDRYVKLINIIPVNMPNVEGIIK